MTSCHHLHSGIPFDITFYSVDLHKVDGMNGSGKASI
jgi:hypothetical protein